MLAHPVARVYADALFGIAKDRGVVDEILAELQDFLDLVQRDGDVARFLDTPVLEPRVKVAHLKKALEGRASDVTSDFLCLLVQKRRAGALSRIVEAYRHMADALAGRARVSVQTPSPLAEGIRTELEGVLRGALDKEIVLEEGLEPALLGGAVVSIGDKVYDGSIRNRISRFRRRIMRSGVYEAQG